MTQQRFEVRRLGQAAAPGAARPMGDQGFTEALAAAPRAVVMFYSPGCPYSQKFMPIYEGLAAQSPDVLFGTVNVDQHVQQAGVNKVQMLPTVVFFLNGSAVGRIDGVQDAADFQAEMARAFSGAPATGAPAAPSPRSGTLVSIEPTKSMVVPYVLGGAAALGILGAAYYLIFGK